MTSLRVSDLHKSYATQEVLRGLDLEIEAGSFTSLLGPSGSGKTTFLRIVAGFERADSGKVQIGDQVVDDGSHFVLPDRRRIGYVPQDGSLFPHLTVNQNVGFGLARKDRRGPRIDELLEMVGLGTLGRRYPHQLSGGQQQRVALARALAVEPALVLLDEPFSSLDAGLRATVRQDVRRVLRDTGATVLMVTHDQDEALSVSDRVALIARGRIGQVDAPIDLYGHPLTPDLAIEFGETNFVAGIARDGGAESPFGHLIFKHGGALPGNYQDGSALNILIRPEQFVLALDLRGAHATGQVIDSEYYGHDAVIRVRPDWDPTTTLLVRSSDARRPPGPGVPVAISVRGRVVAWERGATATTTTSNGTSETEIFS